MKWVWSVVQTGQLAVTGRVRLYRYKTWTLDWTMDWTMNLDYGIDFGLDFGPANLCIGTFQAFPPSSFLIASNLVPKVRIIQILINVYGI